MLSNISDDRQLYTLKNNFFSNDLTTLCSRGHGNKIIIHISMSLLGAVGCLVWVKIECQEVTRWSNLLTWPGKKNAIIHLK